MTEAAQFKTGLVIGQLEVETLLRQPVFGLAQLVYQSTQKVYVDLGCKLIVGRRKGVAYDGVKEKGNE